MTVSTVIISPVGAGCNQACLYCYHSNIRSSNYSVMNIETLEAVIRESFRLNPNKLKFLWHGGEPLLAGIDFYKHVIALQERYRPNTKYIIKNHVQTNCSLVDEEWASFLSRNEFRVSTSIDGPEGIHNKARKSCSPLGSYALAVKGIRALREQGVDVGALVTINSFNSDYPAEVYGTLKEIGIKKFDFNVAHGVPGFQSLAPNPEHAMFFLMRVFDIWFEEDDPNIFVRMFHNTIAFLLGSTTKVCAYAYNSCRHFVACDEKGDFYVISALIPSQ